MILWTRCLNWFLLLPTPNSFCSGSYSSRLTLNRGLGSRRGDRAHGPDHEVLVHQVLVGAILGRVVAEVGDLGGGLRAAEGALVGAVGRADGGRGQASDCASRCCCRAREGASGGCEGCHGDDT